MGSAWPTPSSLVVWDRDSTGKRWEGDTDTSSGGGHLELHGFMLQVILDFQWWNKSFPHKAATGHNPRTWLVLSIWQFNVSAKDIPNTWGNSWESVRSLQVETSHPQSLGSVSEKKKLSITLRIPFLLSLLILSQEFSPLALEWQWGDKWG